MRCPRCDHGDRLCPTNVPALRVRSLALALTLAKVTPRPVFQPVSSGLPSRLTAVDSVGVEPADTSSVRWTESAARPVSAAWGQSGREVIRGRTAKLAASPGEVDVALGGALLAELTLLQRVDLAGSSEQVQKGHLIVTDAPATIGRLWTPPTRTPSAQICWPPCRTPWRQTPGPAPSSPFCSR
jgi:hypothetical protein